MVTTIQLFEWTNTKAFWMVTYKEKWLTVNSTLILISYVNGKFVTQKWQTCYNSQSSKIPWKTCDLHKQVAECTDTDSDIF